MCHTGRRDQSIATKEKTTIIMIRNTQQHIRKLLWRWICEYLNIHNTFILMFDIRLNYWHGSYFIGNISINFCCCSKTISFENGKGDQIKTIICLLKVLCSVIWVLSSLFSLTSRKNLVKNSFLAVLSTAHILTQTYVLNFMDNCLKNSYCSTKWQILEYCVVFKSPHKKFTYSKSEISSDDRWLPRYALADLLYWI